MQRPDANVATHPVIPTPPQGILMRHLLVEDTSAEAQFEKDRDTAEKCTEAKPSCHDKSPTLPTLEAVIEPPFWITNGLP